MLTSCPYFIDLDFDLIMVHRTQLVAWRMAGSIVERTMSVRNRILGPPVPKMPPGLLELMDGLARDVLKNNPENIYDFCARHMQTLLEIRDGRALKPLLTLDQKIETAQKKIKQRAEERRRVYDKHITEDITKQHELSAVDPPRRCDDSDHSEKKEAEVSGNVKPEVKEGIMKVIEKQELDNLEMPISVSESETIEKNNVLNTVDLQEMVENKDDEVNNSQEIITVTDCNEKEKYCLSTNEPKDEDTVKDNETDNSVDNNVSKEVHSQVSSDINIANTDNVTMSLLDEAAIKFEGNDNIEEAIISPEKNDIQCTTIIQNDSGSELQNEVGANINDTNNEMYTVDATTDVTLPSENHLQYTSQPGNNSEQNEKQLNTSKDNPLNAIHTEHSLSADTNGNLSIKQDEGLNELEKSGDDQILNVILGSNSNERAPLQENGAGNMQPNELDSVEVIVTEPIPNELGLKSEQSMDTKEAFESPCDNISNSMDLETAAITIQKVFRSFLFKTKTASYDDPTTVDITLLTEDNEKENDEVINTKDRRHLGISRMDTVLQTVNEEKSLSLSTDDSSTLSSAATIIQAHVRGFLVRNKLNLNKTISSNSLIDSDAPSIPSLEADSDNIKNKTVLNIHIVPEGGHFVSRDESILTSMDLSLDSSPPSSVNLHPLGYDKSERRKQLKREDAIQSVSPPSNNSGKLSEDHDSVKEVLTIENNGQIAQVTLSNKTSIEAHDNLDKGEAKNITENDLNIGNPTSEGVSDEMDVITPFIEGRNSRESDNSTKLLHSGEFHDIVVPTNVTRSDTSVVRGE